ncbi:hypothetical protein Tco_0456525 [Tanacetum coccineum]
MYPGGSTHHMPEYQHTQTTISLMSNHAQTPQQHVSSMDLFNTLMTRVLDKNEGHNYKTIRNDMLEHLCALEIKRRHFVKWIEKYQLLVGLKIPIAIRQRMEYTGDYVNLQFINQIQDEPLIDFTERFNDEASKILGARHDAKQGPSQQRERRHRDPKIEAQEFLMKTLSKTLADILAIKREITDKWQDPPPSKDESKRNNKEYYKLRNDHGQDKNQCMKLKNEIENAVQA